MITDPDVMLRHKHLDSQSAYVCTHCDTPVQLRRFADGSEVVLDVYPTDDGTYCVKADCVTVYRAEGVPGRYERHECTGDES